MTISTQNEAGLNIGIDVGKAVGLYELGIVRAPVEAGLPITVANLFMIRRYADAIGLLAKTNKLFESNLIAFFRYHSWVSLLC